MSLVFGVRRMCTGQRRFMNVLSFLISAVLVFESKLYHILLEIFFCKYILIGWNLNVIGIFYGTSTGSTGDVADLIYEAFGDDVASEPIEIEEIAGDVASNFAKCKWDIIYIKYDPRIFDLIL